MFKTKHHEVAVSSCLLFFSRLHISMIPGDITHELNTNNGELNKLYQFVRDCSHYGFECFDSISTREKDIRIELVTNEGIDILLRSNLQPHTARTLFTQ